MSDQRFIVTIPLRYAQEPHPVHPDLHPDAVAAVTAPDEDTAGRLAFAALGQAWAFVYPEEGFMWRYAPRGVVLEIEAGVTS